jgi:acetyl esterase
MAPYLDPLNQALVDQFATQPPIENLTPQEFRALFEQLQRRDKPIPGVTRTSLVVPFEDGVKTFVFKKDGVKKSEVLPVVLYLHGGAWIAGE